ncbi:MAG: MlaD family protein [Gemmatimonadota bacterium]
MRDPGLRSHYRIELQVGLFVLVALIALVIGVFWVSGTRIGGHRLRFYAATPEAAQLAEGSRIYLRGVDVGSVLDVALAGDHAVLTLEIAQDGGGLPRDTRAAIRPSGFLGSQLIELIPGDADVPLGDGDTIRGGPLPDLQSVAGDLGDRAGRVLEQTEKLLGDETVEGVRRSSTALSATMADLQALISSEREALSTLIESLSATSARLAGATSGPELDRTVANIDSLTSRLRAASAGMDSTSRSLASIVAKVDAGEGSLGKLVNDPELYEKIAAAMENIQVATEEIALLSRDVRKHPERYLEGLKISVF